MTLAEIMRLSFEEIRWRRHVGDDAANLRGSQEYGFRPPLLYPALDLCLPREIELLAGNGEKRAIFVSEATHQRGADHAAVAGDPNSLASQAVDRRGAAPWRKSTEFRERPKARRLRSVCGASLWVGASGARPRRCARWFRDPKAAGASRARFCRGMHRQRVRLGRLPAAAPPGSLSSHQSRRDIASSTSRTE